MTGAIALTVATPLALAVEACDVASLRAEDASGGFGVMPGHADLLTAMDAAVLRWRAASGPWRFAAVRGAILRVSDGARVDVACREATLADDLSALQEQVEAARQATVEAGRRARTEQTRLHARAVREIMRRMGGASMGMLEGDLP